MGGDSKRAARCGHRVTGASQVGKLWLNEWPVSQVFLVGGTYWKVGRKHNRRMQCLSIPPLLLTFTLFHDWNKTPGTSRNLPLCSRCWFLTYRILRDAFGWHTFFLEWRWGWLPLFKRLAWVKAAVCAEFYLNNHRQDSKMHPKARSRPAAELCRCWPVVVDGADTENLLTSPLACLSTSAMHTVRGGMWAGLDPLFL